MYSTVNYYPSLGLPCRSRLGLFCPRRAYDVCRVRESVFVSQNPYNRRNDPNEDIIEACTPVVRHWLIILLGPGGRAHESTIVILKWETTGGSDLLQIVQFNSMTSLSS